VQEGQVDVARGVWGEVGRQIEFGAQFALAVDVAEGCEGAGEDGEVGDGDEEGG